MDVDERPPLNRRTYVRLTVTYLWHHLPQIVFAGLIFSLIGGPTFLLFVFGLWVPALIVGALTVAPAWTALLAYEAEIVRDVKTNIRVMFKALAHYWGRSVGLGLLNVFPFLAAYLTWPTLTQPEVSLIIWFGLAADALGLLVIFTLSLYAFPMLVLHDVSLGVALRNAVILSARYLINTVGLLSMGVLFILATVYLSLGLLFFFPAVWGIFLVNNCRMVIEEEMANE